MAALTVALTEDKRVVQRVDWKGEMMGDKRGNTTVDMKVDTTVDMKVAS